MNRRNDRAGDDLTRRALLQRAGAVGGMLAIPGVLAACGSDSGGGTTGASTSAPTTTAAAAADSSYEGQLQALIDAAKGSKQVIVGTYGGTTEEARRDIFWDPFTEKTGIKVISTDVPGNQGDEMLQGKIPTKWDAFHGSPNETLTAMEVGKKPLPKVPAIAQEDLVPAKYRPYEFQSFILAYVPASLPDTFSGEQPQTWADFFDTKKFPGKRGLPSADWYSGILEAALMGDGVPPDQVYPLDLDRAVAKLKSIVDDSLVWDAYPQAQTFVTSKSTSLCFGPNGLWAGLKGKGVDTTTYWSMTPITSVNSMSIMPDAPDMAAVQALAGFCADPQRQADFAIRTNYGPPSTEAFKKLTTAQANDLPNAPGRTTLPDDVEYIGKHDADIAAAYKSVFA